MSALPTPEEGTYHLCSICAMLQPDTAFDVPNSTPLAAAAMGRNITPTKSVEVLQRLFRGEVARRKLLDARCEEQLDEESVNAHYFGQAEKLWAVALQKVTGAHIPCVFDVRFGYEELVGKLWGQALHESFHSVTGIKAVSFSETVLFLLTINGDVYVHGWSERGQLGLGKTTQTDGPSRLDPATFRGVSKPVMSRTEPTNTFHSTRTWSGCLYGQVSSSLRVRKVVASSDHAILLDTSGTLFAFGDNSGGQLGIDVLRMRGHSFQPSPHLIQLQAPVLDVACGPRHTVVLLKAGFVYHWGSGMLDPAASAESRPGSFEHISAGVLHNAVQVFAGHNTCFVQCSDGRIHSWGSNASFQLGHSRLRCEAFLLKPTVVTAAHSQGEASTLRVRKFAAGTHHCVAVTAGEEVVGWGSNKSNQLSHAPDRTLRDITKLDYTSVPRPKATHVWAAERFSVVYHIETATNDAYLSVLGETAWQLPDALAAGGHFEYYATEVTRPRLRQHLLRVADRCRGAISHGYVRGNRAMSCFLFPSRPPVEVAAKKLSTRPVPRLQKTAIAQSSVGASSTRNRSNSEIATTKDTRSVRSHSPYRLARRTRHGNGTQTPTRRLSEAGFPTRYHSEHSADTLSSSMLEHLQLLIDR